jgi:hypothetical protein
MEEFFNKLIENKLTPNQYFVLHSINTSVDSKLINLKYESVELIEQNWLSEDYKLTDKSKDLMSEVENWFKKSTTKRQNKLLGKDSKENIEKYREMFPKGMVNGRPIRTSTSNITVAFKKFFKDHQYSWEVILSATKLYLGEQKMNDYKYCKNARYFIIKSTNQLNHSLLADYCEIIESGDYRNGGNDVFKEKVL